MKERLISLKPNALHLRLLKGFICKGTPMQILVTLPDEIGKERWGF
ncbi:MAG: hypothetical protein RIT27_1109 [Pseudomonadota bacterium]|jgi:hypothetical protein